MKAPSQWEQIVGKWKHRLITAEQKRMQGPCLVAVQSLEDLSIMNWIDVFIRIIKVIASSSGERRQVRNAPHSYFTARQRSNLTAHRGRRTLKVLSGILLIH